MNAGDQARTDETFAGQHHVLPDSAGVHPGTHPLAAAAPLGNEDEQQSDADEPSILDGVAIIGMAGRFPGAPDLATFWANLVAGKDTITRFSAEQLEARNASAREGSAEYVAARGVLEGAGLFDAAYFGISPREAERMDPQHRVFLETCSDALEDAGYGSPDYPGEIGLFAGCSLNTYLLANLMGDRAALEELAGNYQVGDFQTALGNDKDFLTTRVAYKLNLRGPCVSVQSACATSLVAVCQASQALLNFQCDMALAGGVSITFPQHRGHVYQEGGIVSSDGHCRPFDRLATGTVFGHGAGAVLLKRVDDALRDGDRIAAVLRGFAVNNDGSAKAGYMAPGVEGQARVIRAAQAMAGCEPQTITYIEAHGTGTPLGDPIELAALTEAFRSGAPGGPAARRRGFCTVGTAKGNVGHLDSAAGITGLLKTVLSLEHRTLPGLAHFEAPNPNLDLDDSPFVFRAQTTPWQADGPLRAGVSAFGVGGVNAHVVVEEAPAQLLPASTPSRRPLQVLAVSARSAAAARQAADQLAASLESAPGRSLADAAFTLACGRRQHGFRIAVAAIDSESAVRQLRAAHPVEAGPRRAAFLFSGQGTQFVGMGRELYEAEPAYRAVVDDCTAQLFEPLGLDLRDLLFGDPADAALADRLGETRFAQPALFVTGLALATLWTTWGMQPEVLLGHSLGEYVAATLAGVFTRADALRLVAARGRLMGSLPAGAMLSVAFGVDALGAFLDDDLSLAAINGPRACVLSGSFASIAAAEAKLAEAGVATRRLRTSHAFHSAMMEPALSAFEHEFAGLTLRAPAMPIVSSVTGKLLTDDDATSARYWVLQCRQPVRFAAALETLMAGGPDLLLEIGAGDTLTRLALAQHGRAGNVLVCPSLVPAREGRPEHRIYDTLATVHAASTAIDWAAFFADEPRLRLSLPTYPFERQLYWVAPSVAQATPPASPAPPAPTLHEPAPHGQQIMTEPLPSSSPSLPAAPAPPARTDQLCVRIASILTELSGFETTAAEADHGFLELGFDSLFLTQAAQCLSKAFGVKITFRMLMESSSSIRALAEHLDGVLPPEPPAPDAQPKAPPVLAAPVALEPASGEPAPTPAAHASALERLMSEQVRAMTQLFGEQMASLRAATGQPGAVAPAQTPAAQPQPAPPPLRAQGLAAAPADRTSPEPAEVRHGSFRPLQAKAQHELTSQQTRYIADLVARYVARTPGSKRLTAEGRPHLADPRAVAGFRPQWKEMVYPLIVERAHGSRLWDVDGNEFIDIVNGYGCILFGHSPAFVVEAAREQLERGVAIGPQTPLAAEVAALICNLTGNERVTFCNTGSEAVMAAIRVARTVTGRDTIVYFAGDYHGTFDEVLIRNTPRGSAPVAPGIPLANVTNVVVLDYGTDASLTYLREHAGEIAAVMIEPVQTRNPALQPAEFMRSVRQITEQAGSALILDEVVTGFRLAPGGAQQHFGIRADMCTYGKVIGGGHPIGVLSGKREYLDALDGGAWAYGDDSSPEVGVTFFAGTFVRHPLALAAARAVLKHLEAAGPALQAELNAKTARLAGSLDRFMTERGVPTRIHHFASWFYFTFPHDARLGSLLYYAMRVKGIHIQEGYPCFLTTAHSDADLDAIERAFRETIDEMQAAGVLPGHRDQSLPTMLASGVDDPPEQADTPSAGSPERAPLTEPQREIFLAAALNDEANCAFNESLTLRLAGPIREPELIVALETVHARHDALRSTVSEDGDSLEIGKAFKGTVEISDLRGLDAAAQEDTLRQAAEHEARTPFDLARGPLTRAVYFRLADDAAALMITAHHLILDGWSASLLLEEVGKVYNLGAAAQGALAPLLPFSQYALAEQTRERKGDFADNEAFWVAQFSGRTPRLDLPTDRPRPAIKSYQGSTFAGQLGSELTAALRTASARAGTTLYVTLLSAFQMLMHRLSAQAEVVVGVSTAGQALLGGQSLVGHCVHFLPMLSTLAEDTTAREHARATRAALLDAYDHQEFTYGSLLRKLHLEREGGRLPLIEVQFNLEKLGTNVVFDGLRTSIAANPKAYVNTDLFLNVIETPERLEFTCDFNTTLFDRETIARWMASWTELLQAATSSADTRVAELPLLSPAERELTFGAWNETACDFGAFTPVSAVLLDRARRQPERIAIQCAGKTWSVGELAAYATRVACTLEAEGLEPGDLVGILVSRTPAMVGALLGVLLAGGAYVPLDPRHPRERIEGVLEDSGAKLLLTDRPPYLTTSARLVQLESTERASVDHFAPAPLAPDSLAYVIYTSGSTGAPKGVAVEHGALRNLLESMQREPGLDERDVLVAITTLAFDIAALELLLPVLVGARLVIATEEETTDGALLLSLLGRMRATVLQGTPGAWRILLDAGLGSANEYAGTSRRDSETDGRRPLKALCGGEALPRDLAEALLGRGVELWNVYGPTETTIWSSATRVEHGEGPLRLGMPIANTQFYILGERRQLAPVGVTGELFIGGAGLARGYWRRAELTAERFIAAPFGEGRLYASGDLARRHADGSVELQGRTDFQVKIRGYRIELAEIEAALRQHERVREAVVIAHQPPGTAAPRLLAYLTTTFGVDATYNEALQRELTPLLAESLPDYMIPSAYLVLEHLPRTANGKIDRKALPLEGLAASRPAGEGPRGYVAPSTPEQETLAAIWAELLELDRVSVEDSIFELGADSLVIFRMAARAQRTGLQIRASDIFERRTIAALCAAMRRELAVAAPAGAVPARIVAASRERYRMPRGRADA